MHLASRVESILRTDPLRWHVLDVVRRLDLPDCWIGAGFVRNAVWDHLHQRAPSPPTSDIDVVWHDPAQSNVGVDHQIEAALRAAESHVHWSVKNQARMHERNGDTPYPSSVEAMRHWPETATAVGVRRHGINECEIAAPWGLDDLLSLLLRPTPAFSGEKFCIFNDRIRTKGWMLQWPRLQLAER